jgi:DNA replication protein DnaC
MQQVTREQLADGGRRCKTCADKIKRGETRRKRKSKQECYRRQLEVIPNRYRAARLHQTPKKLAGIIRECSDVLLFGGVGVGKTHAACAGLRYRLNSSITYANWESLCIDLRDFGNGSEAGKLAKLTEPDTLVLDDIGTSSSDFSTRALFCIIDKRLNDCKRTILTSNCTPNELEAMYGPRIGSRLAYFRMIEIKGKDRRRA